MKKLLLAMSTILVSEYAVSACIPAREFIEYPGVTNIGMYQRIHPEGKYLLHSAMDKEKNPEGNQFYSSVVMYDISQRDEDGKVIVKPIETPMNDEVYASPLDWKIITSPRHNDGMRFYSLDEILSKGKKAAPFYTDKNRDEFYQSVGEITGSDKNLKRLKVLYLSRQRTAEYTFKNEENWKNINEVNDAVICHNILIVDPTAPTEKERSDAKTAYEKLSQKVAVLNKRLETEKDNDQKKYITNKREKILAKIEELRTYASRPYTKYEFSSPVISPDGTEVAVDTNAPGFDGVERQSGVERIYRIKNDNSCELVDDIGFFTSKVQFSYPVPGKKGKVVFFGSPSVRDQDLLKGIYIYDRDTKQLTMVANDEDYTDIGYAGLTKDGRVIFPACQKIDNKNKCGAVVIDPNQVNPENAEIKKNDESCISKETVDSYNQKAVPEIKAPEKAGNTKSTK